MVGVEPELESMSIDALASAVSAYEIFRVISRTDIEAMLGAELLKDAVGCDEVSCMAEIGAAAGVDRIISGSISSVDDALVVSLNLVNVRYGNVENRVTLEWPGSQRQLSEVLGVAAELLVLPRDRRGPGGLRLAGVPAQANVFINGEPKGVGPLSVEGLPVGIHTLRVEAPEIEPYVTPFTVRSNAMTFVEAQPQERAEKPFYTKWWFWGVTGAVLVAGGATAAYFLTRGGSEGPSGSIRIVGDAPAALRW